MSVDLTQVGLLAILLFLCDILGVTDKTGPMFCLPLIAPTSTRQILRLK
jgi:hypothetical protein